jgi:hypothetical protein
MSKAIVRHWEGLRRDPEGPPAWSQLKSTQQEAKKKQGISAAYPLKFSIQKALGYSPKIWKRR